MTDKYNLKKAQFKCDENNAQVPQNDVIIFISKEIGCNLPWSSIKISMKQLIQYFFVRSITLL